MITEKIKSKIATQFKILESSEKDSTKIYARKEDSEVQKHVSYMEQQLESLRDMKYEVYKMMIDNNVEHEIVGECVNMTMKKIERYQELIDRLKGCLEDLLEKKKSRNQTERRSDATTEVQKKNGKIVEN